MKLWHKQLLRIGILYAALLVAVWLLHLLVIEPSEIQRFRQDSRRELFHYARSIRIMLDRAKAEARDIARQPALASGDAEQIVGEFQRRKKEKNSLFVEFEFLGIQGLRCLSDGTVTQDAFGRLQSHSPEDVTILDSRTVGPNSIVVVPVAAPVRNGAGDLVGHFVGDVPVLDILPALGDTEDTSPKLLALRTGSSNTLTRLNATTRAKGPYSPYPGSPYEDEGMSGWVGTSIEIAPENWHIGINVPRRELLRSTRRFRNWTLALIGLSLLIELGGTFWSHRGLTRRYDALREAMQRFGASDQSVRSDDRGSDELGRLADAFNCMADDVVHWQRQRQQQLAEHQSAPSQWKEMVGRLEGRVEELERYDRSIAHEFQGPLVTLERYLGDFEGLAKSGRWDELHGDVRRVRRLCGQLRDAANVLLQLANGEAGCRCAPQPVQLEQAAQEAQDMMQAVIDQRRASLSIASGLPTVRGDAALWRHVFRNLVENALKACAEVDSPKIEIGCQQRDGEFVCFVRDNGPGMPPDTAAQVFDSTPAAANRGIGLKLVQRIVEFYGGKAWAESSGTGTTVYWTVMCP